jgi:hypothetical protein
MSVESLRSGLADQSRSASASMEKHLYSVVIEIPRPH